MMERIALDRSGVSVVAMTLADAIRPPVRMKFSEWAGKHLVAPDGPRAGDVIDLAMTPHLIEIIDNAMPDNGVTEWAVRKSAQTGFTLALQAIALATSCLAPCAIMITQPTTTAVADFNRDKLAPAIEGTVPARRVIRKQDAKATGSTATTKVFRGGFIKLAGANSAADLAGKTIKVAQDDEIDRYPEDLDDQGSPLDMIEARQQAFEATGDWKRGRYSTPTVKGASAIDRLFEQGDQRYWTMPCPGCGEDFIFEFTPETFRFNPEPPHHAHSVTRCCGTVIEYRERTAVFRRGRWAATQPGNPWPSYHFDALSSPFVLWDKVVERWLKAQASPEAMKTFMNLTLGLPYDVKGDAPDHERLMERRDRDLKRGFIPPRGIVTVLGADVQGNGIYYIIRAFSPDGQSWPVDADFIAGDTDDWQRGAFAELRKVIDREWPDSFGGKRRLDAAAIDSGFRSHAVYMFCRAGAVPVHAIKGDDGWSKPAFGVGVPVEINWRNQRIRNGVLLHKVGTWPLKGEFYALLQKRGLMAGGEADPAGYVHFAGWQDAVYFRQITSEHLETQVYRGRPRRMWVVRKGEENHFLDCEIYLRALHWQLTTHLTIEDWHVLAANRNVPAEAITPSLFSPEPMKVRAETPTKVSLSDNEAATPPRRLHRIHRDDDIEL